MVSSTAQALGPFVVFFDSGSTAITPRAAAILDNFASSWRSTANASVEINGHSDHLGSSAYNRRLSCDRAAAVRAFLVTKGVPESRITIAGYGADRPLIEEPVDESDRRQNRRVEALLVPGGYLESGKSEQLSRCP